MQATLVPNTDIVFVGRRNVTADYDPGTGGLPLVPGGVIEDSWWMIRHKCTWSPGVRTRTWRGWVSEGGSQK